MIVMNYSRLISDRWSALGGQARQEVDADLGSGSVFRLIGRGGIIFCRGPYCRELNVDARKAGGIYVRDCAAWCFPVEIKPAVQAMTRRACDLTMLRRRFLADRHAMYIVKKRLAEAQGKFRIHSDTDTGLVFVRSDGFLPPSVTGLLKTRVYARWCPTAGAWMLSSLDEGELYRLIEELNAPPSELTDFSVM